VGLGDLAHDRIRRKVLRTTCGQQKVVVLVVVEIEFFGRN
jgi:hypothetical protein